MAITNPVASSRPMQRNVFERIETCHAPSDVGAKLHRLQNKGLAKYARARRHTAPKREGAREFAAVDPPRRSDAEQCHDTGIDRELPSQRRETAKAIGEILVLAVALGLILTAAVAVAAGLAYFFIV
jgi:hypothetical protein